MDPTPGKKELTHRRIVDAAAKAIRLHGYAGVGVADVMKEAGLTHGGFYAHFESRDALLIEALERAARDSAGAARRRMEAAGTAGISPFRALVEGYLHDDLLKAPGAGCPVAALCAEMPRQSVAVRRASATGIGSLLGYVEQTLAPAVPRNEVSVVAATLIGSLQLARAIGTVAQGKVVLASARISLLERYDRP